MRPFALAISLAVLCAFPVAGQADEPLPLIQETVDEIIILRTVGNQYARVIFIRDDAILATRLLLDDMMWTATGDKFQLMWQDYSIAERVVEAKTFSIFVTPHDPTQADRCGPWWCMFRNMRDLKQP